MPADIVGRSSPSSVAATPSSGTATPEKPERRHFSEHRKSSKPIMEKRRRARINESLGQLKTLILDALKKDSSRHSKLEKADILEMTVKHLRGLQRIQMTGVAGFGACVGEVTRFLSTCEGEGASAEVRARLLGHLAACASQVNAADVVASSYAAPPQTTNGIPCKRAPAVNLSADAVKLYAAAAGFQVLLPAQDGHLALLIPHAPLAAPFGSAKPDRRRPAAAAAAHAPAMSRVAPHLLAAAADSVWRPW
ncbi:hypothetical protein CRUP_033346 [Coryphaenoides rupestris]|nr:hypothetical protein CRUP_033346 [Coryphaenoides rupestris]